MLTRGGDRQASRVMWTQIGQNEESDWLRTTAQLRLAQLDALDQIDVLKRIVNDFTSRTGQRAQSWEQLAAAGAVRGAAARSGRYSLHVRRGDRRNWRRAELGPLAASDRACGCARAEARGAAGAAMNLASAHSPHDLRDCGRQLSQCLHPSAAAAEIADVARIALPALPGGRSNPTTTSRLPATCGCAAAAEAAVHQFPSSTRSSSSRPAPSSWARICCSIRRRS